MTTPHPPIVASGRLVGTEAARFIDLVLAPQLLGRCRVVEMPDAEQNLLSDMRRHQLPHPIYVAALARLARVTLRKARIFLGLDRGRITRRAEQMLRAALAHQQLDVLVDAATREGREARAAGLPWSHCPYSAFDKTGEPPSSTVRSAWLRAWHEPPGGVAGAP